MHYGSFIQTFGEFTLQLLISSFWLIWKACWLAKNGTWWLRLFLIAIVKLLYKIWKSHSEASKCWGLPEKSWMTRSFFFLTQWQLKVIWRLKISYKLSHHVYIMSFGVDLIPEWLNIVTCYIYTLHHIVATAFTAIRISFMLSFNEMSN